MSIWNVNNIAITDSPYLFVPKEVRLWKYNDGNFSVIEQGDYLSILDGAAYTLIKKKFAPIFHQLIDQVTIHPAIIVDTVLKSNNAEYVELLSCKTITPEGIHNEDASGLKLWTYNGSLFVSDDLKHLIEQHGKGELQFHLDFQWWG